MPAFRQHFVCHPSTAEVDLAPWQLIWSRSDLRAGHFPTAASCQARNRVSTTRTRSNGSTGLTRCRSNPAASIRSQFGGSFMAVNATSTSRRRSAQARSLTASSSPSIPGMFKSRKQRPGRNAPTSRRAAGPS